MAHFRRLKLSFFAVLPVHGALFGEGSRVRSK
jgi:hypothetical protein